MLTSPKKPVLIQPQPTHVDLFVEYYDLLRRWAVQFTEHNKDLADDLLHDTFIHFTLTKPDLSSIQNLDGYLFVMMRNLHLSQLRRTTRSPIRAFAAIEYDTADMSFWASDPRDHLRMRDELNAVCQFACIRKEGSKAGSILILRFFHGYYPDEIALVMHSTRGAVNFGVKQARAEARLYLEEPERLGLVDEKSRRTSKITVNALGGDLRLALRGQIFDSRQGICLTRGKLEELYKPERVDGLDRQSIAHIVSCQTCIENVNSLLGLPPLSSRYPLDTIGKDPGKKGGSGGSGGVGGGSNMLDSFISRRDAHYYHEPRELCISVNGQLQGLQKIVSGTGELMLVLDTSENVGFVEVFSELGLRLLMLSIEPPPVGDGKQSTRIELSGGRTIDATLNFSGAHPALQVTYNDPEPFLQTAELTTEEPAAAAPQLVPPFLTGIGSDKANSFGLNAFLDGLKFWLEPVRLTAAFAILIVAIVGLLFFTRPVEKALTAGDVLAHAARNEVDIVARPDLAIRSTFRIEKYSNGTLISKSRVDEWQKADASVRRVFDSEEKMIAGEWQKDGKTQIFTAGEKLRPATANESSTDEISAITPSARQFASLMEKTGSSSLLELEQAANTYSLTFRKSSGAGPQAKMDLPGELLVASLVLDQKSLDPRSEILFLKIGDETREYRFTDIQVEEKPVDTISPLIFLPEAELLHGATKVIKPVEITDEGLTEANTDWANSAKIASKATLETEVEVVKLLDSVNALSGEPITLTRMNGQLRIVGIVDSASRKAEIVAALAPVRTGHGVVIEIETAEEATNRKRSGQSSGNISIESMTVAADQSYPVDVELRALLTRRGIAADRMDEEMQSLVTTITANSRVLRRNALALKQIAERFTPSEIEKLDPAKREEWRALVRSRARGVAGDARSLQTQLSQLFPGRQPGESNVASDVKNAFDASPAAQRLFGLAAACDSQVSQSFSISSGARGAAPVRSAQFWRNLAQMSAIAAGLQDF